MPCGGGPKLLGKFLYQLSESQKHDLPMISKKHKKRCPECSMELNGDFTWCPQCGARLQPIHCEYCGGLVPRDAAVCSRCGAPVG